MTSKHRAHSKSTGPLPEREWTHRLSADEITFSPTEKTVRADAASRKQVAERLDLISIEDLKADLVCQRISGGHIVKVSGTLNADVTQKCVVSLKPVQQHVCEDFEAYYTNQDEAVSFSAASKRLKQKNDQGEIEVMEEWEDPEDMEEGTIDLGELVVQHLSLGLEPFPHAQGEEFEEGDEPEMLRQPSDIRKNPFAALQYWKEDGEDDSD